MLNAKGGSQPNSGSVQRKVRISELYFMANLHPAGAIHNKGLRGPTSHLL
jgi:hypothetical protein